MTVQVSAGRFRSMAVVAAAAVVLALMCTLMVTRAWSVDAAPGDDDSTFVPTAGCRLTDTRPAPRRVGPRSTPLGADQTFVVKVHGSNGKCTGALAIPADAVAVALNATAVNATAESNIRLYPANLSSVPLLSNLNVTAGAPPIPNKVDVKLSPDGRIEIYNFRGSVDIVIDVVGYYTSSSLNALSAGLAAANARIDALEAAAPFAKVATGSSAVALTTTPKSYLEVEVTAPVDGHVTVNHSSWINNSDEGGESACNVYLSTQIPGSDISAGAPGVGWFEAGLADGEGTVSGTNRFTIGAGQTATYSLACLRRGGASSDLEGRALTAIFTPAP